MGRPKKNREREAPTPAAPDATKPETTETQASPNPNLYRPTESGVTAAAGKTRASFAIKEDGVIDVEGMRSDNLSRLRELLRDPRNQQALGLVKADEPLIIISEDEVRQLYQMISVIEVTLAPMAKIHPQAAREVIPYSPEEIEKLTPATQRVVSKWGPDWLLKWKDEIALAVMLLMITRSKFELARKRTAEIVAHEEQRKTAVDEPGRA